MRALLIAVIFIIFINTVEVCVETLINQQGYQCIAPAILASLTVIPNVTFGLLDDIVMAYISGIQVSN